MCKPPGSVGYSPVAAPEATEQQYGYQGKRGGAWYSVDPVQFVSRVFARQPEPCWLGGQLDEKEQSATLPFLIKPP